MATFITTIKFTQQGIANIEDSTKRAEDFKEAAKKIGVKVADVYWTLGNYDGLLILEAPDDETAMNALLHLSAVGNVHTTTVRAFTAAEMDKIVVKHKMGKIGFVSES
ncbi:MAG: GYD domain-containing protein [Planctomycetales bacterium]